MNIKIINNDFINYKFYKIIISFAIFTNYYSIFEPALVSPPTSEICLEKDSVDSNMKPRFLADRLGIMGLVVGRERGVDYFRSLLRETDKKEFSFRWIESEIVRRRYLFIIKLSLFIIKRSLFIIKRSLFIIKRSLFTQFCVFISIS